MLNVLKQPEVINEFNNAAEYRINKQKSFILMCACD